jgi:hypothetical protein
MLEKTMGKAKEGYENLDETIRELRTENSANKLKIEQLKHMILLLTNVVPRSLGQCSGYKCREPYCISCNDEDDAEKYLNTVFILRDAAFKMLKEME